MKENMAIRELEEIDEFKRCALFDSVCVKSFSRQVRFGEEEAGHSCLMLQFRGEFVKCD